MMWRIQTHHTNAVAPIASTVVNTLQKGHHLRLDSGFGLVSCVSYSHTPAAVYRDERGGLSNIIGPLTIQL